MHPNTEEQWLAPTARVPPSSAFPGSQGVPLSHSEEHRVSSAWQPKAASGQALINAASGWNACILQSPQDGRVVPIEARVNHSQVPNSKQLTEYGAEEDLGAGCAAAAATNDLFMSQTSWVQDNQHLYAPDQPQFPHIPGHAQQGVPMQQYRTASQQVEAPPRCTLAGTKMESSPLMQVGVPFCSSVPYVPPLTANNNAREDRSQQIPIAESTTHKGQREPANRIGHKPLGKFRQAIYPERECLEANPTPSEVARIAQFTHPVHIPGVRLNAKKKQWLAAWNIKPGKEVRRYFSVTQHGYEQAWQLAVFRRWEAERAGARTRQGTSTKYNHSKDMLRSEILKQHEQFLQQLRQHQLHQQRVR